MLLFDKVMRRIRAVNEVQSPTSPISKSSVDNDGDEATKLDYDGNINTEKKLGSEGSIVKTVDDEEVQKFNGEPVITNGRDVSRYVVDLRDDGDPALTLRSLTLGTVFAGLGAALCQVYEPLFLNREALTWGLDLSVQTCSDDGINGLLASADLHRWECLGQIFTHQKDGHRNPV